MKLLHLIATPRPEKSNTLKISNAFLASYRAKYSDLEVEEISLFSVSIPASTGDYIDAKYNMMTRQPLNDTMQTAWDEIERTITHFLSADIYLISTPMWNFGIPYTLKHYIDTIVQPGYLFGYNEQGMPFGMVKDKKMVCVTTRGGDYSENSPFHIYDSQEPYLRAIFGFVGITNVHFVNAQPMDMSPELRNAAIANGISEAQSLAGQL